MHAKPIIVYTMGVKLKLQYFGHLMRRVDSLEKTLMLGGIEGHPGNQASSQGEAKNSAVLLGRDGYLLEPTVCHKGSQASCGVWIEDSGFLSRPCRKRRPSSRDDGGVSWVF